MTRITEDVNLIVDELIQGNVVALPTETVYGLAADATNDEAVKKIFTIKNRPVNHPLIMHVAPNWDLHQWVEQIPKYAIKLIQHFWPGPMTMVFKLKKTANISRYSIGNQETVAIRSPNHPLALDILNKLGRPLVAPSANPFGKVSPTEAKHVLQDFPDDSFLILDGERCSVGIESTIINCIDENSCSLLRPGIITESELKSFCEVFESQKRNNIKVSGNLKTHYQPQKKLFYFNSKEISLVKSKFTNINNFYLLCFSLIFDKDIINYLFSSIPSEAASEFYRQLRMADKSNKSFILMQLPPETPQWVALIERIKKAGTPLFDSI